MEKFRLQLFLNGSYSSYVEWHQNNSLETILRNKNIRISHMASDDDTTSPMNNYEVIVFCEGHKNTIDLDDLKKIISSDIQSYVIKHEINPFTIKSLNFK